MKNTFLTIILSALVISSSALMLTACGDKKDENTTTEPSTSQNATVVNTTSLEETTNALPTAAIPNDEVTSESITTEIVSDATGAIEENYTEEVETTIAYNEKGYPIVAYSPGKDYTFVE